MEDSEQNIHLKNLSAHQATNEEEALNLLFIGDTNRMIAEVCCGLFDEAFTHLPRSVGFDKTTVFNSRNCHCTVHRHRIGPATSRRGRAIL